MSVTTLAAYSKGPYQGRDKFAKAMQFGARIVAYQIMQSDPTNESAKKMVLFLKQLGVSRKGLRLGKSVEELAKLQKTLAKSKPSVDMALDLVTQVGMSFRWFYDNLGFLEKIKVLPKSDYGVLSNKFRVVATVAYITINLKKFLAKFSKYLEQPENAKVKAAVFEASLALISRCADMMNALHGAKLYQTNDGIQGVCGFLSAVIAIRKVVNAM